jgi:hypothetical protein
MTSIGWSVKWPARQLAVLFGLLAGWAGVVFAQDPAPKRIVIVLPEESSFVTHRIADAAYQIQVTLPRNLVHEGQVEFHVSSVEHGPWRIVSDQSGELVASQTNWDQIAGRPRPAAPYQFEYHLKFTPNPLAPDERYEREMKELERLAEREVSQQTNPVKWKSTVRKLTVEHLKRQSEAGVLDELLQHLPVKLPRGAPERDILELWNELTGVLYGRIKTADMTRILSPDDFDTVQRAATVRVVLGFTPLIGAGEPDRNWSVAPRVSLEKGRAESVRFQGSVGAGHRESEWLALRLPRGGKLQVASSADSGGIVWTQVAGEGGWQYVRIAPRDAKQPAPFDVVVGLGEPAGEPAIEVQAAPVRKVRLPF